MLGEPSRPTIPLPKQWPSQVRSGVLHAISLAHFTLTFTRSWAANSFNARIRLKQDNDRLRQELALLREEMRIKDSRMLRISAQRRPHYPAISAVRCSLGSRLSNADLAGNVTEFPALQRWASPTADGAAAPETPSTSKMRRATGLPEWLIANTIRRCPRSSISVMLQPAVVTASARHISWF